uniref:Uncharacterized protein n=1 Tax=Solanum tuberosum TaxID=4113 RepID=M1DLR1_SOLTU
MAREPPVGLFRPPDQSQSGCYDNSNKTHKESSTNSSNNSVNSRKREVISSAISEKELEETREIISPQRNTLIQGKMVSGIDSPNQELQHTEKSLDSTEPIARIGEATLAKIQTESPEMCLQIRASSQRVHGESTSRDYSPNEDVHLTEISDQMDGRIVGNQNSGKRIFP